METLSFLNANTNAVLATKAMSSFGAGVYAVFNISGNVTLQVNLHWERPECRTERVVLQHPGSAHGQYHGAHIGWNTVRYHQRRR